MKHTLLAFALIGLLAATGFAADKKSPPGLRAGAAVANITPPLGLPVVGGFSPFPSTNIHDQLHVRCLVLDDGKTKLALVVCDLLGIDRLVSDEARKRIKDSAGIPIENVLISTTHTHSASSAIGDRYKFPPTLDAYQEFVVNRIVDVVACALKTLRPAEIGFVTVNVPEHCNNRRWYLKPGTMPPNPFGGIDKAKMNPSAGSDSLAEPAGPIDPGISVIAVREPDSHKPIALYSAYSLHYVGGVGHADISADYYGIYSRRMEQPLNAQDQYPPFVAMMANGTSGDINNINFRERRPSRKPYEQMTYAANDVATKVHAALASVQYRSGLTLAAAYREPVITCRRPTPEQLAWADQKLANPPPKGKVDLSYIYADRTKRMAAQPATLPIPLQALRIGSICVGTMPTEIFCEIGLDFKRLSPLQPAFLVSLAHGYYGYLPTPRHHELGGYETWLGTSRLEPRASETLMTNLLEMAKELKK